MSANFPSVSPRPPLRAAALLADCDGLYTVCPAMRIGPQMDTLTECRMTEHQMIQHRMTERRMTERQMTERRTTKCRKRPNVE